MKNVLIKNGRIWDGSRFFYGDILTEDDKIVKIAEHIEADGKYLFDAAGKIVSAGLVDIHVHMRGISTNTFGISPDLSCIPFGVTAACDACGMQGDERILAAFCVKSAVFACWVIEGDRFDAAATEKRMKLFGAQCLGIKVYLDMRISPNCNADTLRQVCAYATEKGCKVMVHCSHSPIPMEEIVEILRPGDILSHIYHGAENICAVSDYAAFRLAKQKGIVLDAGFAGAVHTDLAVFRDAVERGWQPDTISTDITASSAYCRGGRYGLTQCMSMARSAGMGEEDIFRAVTTTPARALGMPWGTLQEGAVADICVLEYGNEPFSLQNSHGAVMEDAMGYRCVMTIVNGNVVYRD